VMVLNPKRFVGGKIQCLHCKYKQQRLSQRMCYHCYDQTATSTTFRLGNESVAICKTCDKPWMTKHNIMSQLSVESFHQAINERWTIRRAEAHLGIASRLHG